MTSYITEIPSLFSEREEINEILEYLVELDGSDIFIAGGLPIYGRIKEKKYKFSNRRLSADEVNGISEIIGGQGTESKLGENAEINISYEYKLKKEMKEGLPEVKRRRFRVNISPCFRNGERSVTIVFRPIKTDPPLPEDIGLEQEIVDVVLKSKQGLMLMVGATGTGKTTTLAALVRAKMERDPNGIHLVSAEDPIEFIFDGINPDHSFPTQREVGKTVSSFEHAMRDAMRQHPDALLLGEIRGYETMRSALSMADSGHFTFSTMHTNSVSETLQRGVSFYPPELQRQAKHHIINALSIVCSQRLVPTIDGKVIALKEYLIFDREIKSQLIAAEDFVETAHDLVKTKGVSMAQAAEKAFNEGKISQYWYDSIIMSVS